MKREGERERKKEREFKGSLKEIQLKREKKNLYFRL